MLRKIYLFYNQIYCIREGPLSLPFLMEIHLNNNKMLHLEGLGCLPCLEYLNVKNNQIQHLLRADEIIAIPNLKTFLVDGNLIDIFQNLVIFLEQTKRVQTLGFEENPFARTNCVDLLEFFEYFLLKINPDLNELNKAEIQKNRIKFMEGKFSVLVGNFQN